MTRQRAQAIIFRDDKVLFGFGQINKKGLGHFFIGGGLEGNETPEEAVIREVKEEANIDAKIIFKFENELKDFRHTFLVDIGNQKPSLGYDPEEAGLEKEMLSLQDLIWISLSDTDKFTTIDINYFKLLIEECKKRTYKPNWLNKLINLTENYEN
jgi:8-oxo-dGTP pyrophosphatase MutT (NUDIX family)